MPLSGRPVKSIGRACFSDRALSYSSRPTRTMRSRPTMPQHMWPVTRNARPPNIFRSVTSRRSRSSSRMRLASASSYAIARSEVPVLQLDDLGALRRPGLAGRLVEPDLIAARVEDLEGAVAPPLGRELVGDPDALLLQPVVIRVDVRYLQVDFHRLLRHRRLPLAARRGRAREHEP